MTIELPTSVEEQLRDLAVKQGRGIEAVVAEAVREYLVASSITDLDASDVAAAQVTLLEELRGIPAWKGGHA